MYLMSDFYRYFRKHEPNGRLWPGPGVADGGVQEQPGQEAGGSYQGEWQPHSQACH